MKKLFLALSALLLLCIPAQSQEWDIQIPDYEIKPMVIPYGEEVVDWGVRYLKSAEFWSKSKGQNAIAFILDTGIETDHPDLRDRIILPYCKDFTNDIANGYRDLHGHGTHCAGITAATHENGIGVVGNAPLASLVAVKVLNNQGSGNFTTVAQGVRYVADLALTGQHQGKYKVISMSLGGGSGSAELEAAINYAISKGCIVVAAAGNSGCGLDNTIGFPGKYPVVITVASIGTSELASGFSSCGEQIDVCAPGENILSTGKGGGYVQLSGTSMATPAVAGVICMVVSAYPQLKDQAGVEKFLRKGAKDLPPTGWDKKTGAGSTVCTGYLAPPDGGDNPPPPPQPGDPVRATRTISLPVPGQYAFIWKASNETTFHRAVVTEVVVETKTNKWTETAVRKTVQALDAFFAGGSRGFGLLQDADLYEAGRWSAYFVSLLNRDPGLFVVVKSMKVQDETGNTILYDVAKDKARELPQQSGLFKVRTETALKRAARAGSSTWVK